MKVAKYSLTDCPSEVVGCSSPITCSNIVKIENVKCPGPVTRQNIKIENIKCSSPAPAPCSKIVDPEIIELPRPNRCSKVIEIGAGTESNPAIGGQHHSPETVYEVERVVDYRLFEDGEGRYLIKWKNWNDKCNTWEPHSNVSGCTYLLQQFYFDRRKEHYELLKVHNSKSINKGKKRPCSPSEALSLPPIPPDFRTMDEIGDEYACEYPITQKEFDGILAKTGTKVGKGIKMKKTEFSQLVARAMFDLLPPDRVQYLRRSLIKIEIHKRKKTLDLEIRRWQLEINSIACEKPYIEIENTVDLTLPPSYFTYRNYTEIRCEVRDVQASGCFCDGECFSNRESCCGPAAGSDFAYNRSHRVIVPPGTPIFECNDNCDCGEECPNRVAQDGYKSMENKIFLIFRTSNRGWGVKTRKNIRRGAFVCLLVGELISNEQAAERQRSVEVQQGKYLFDLEFYGESQYVIDFSLKGNISHFLNHSCSPNLVVHPNWWNNSTFSLPRIAFYALVDIPADTELTFSYVDVEEFRTRYQPEFKDGTIPEGFQRCECGTANCVQYMIFPDQNA